MTIKDSIKCTLNRVWAGASGGYERAGRKLAAGIDWQPHRDDWPTVLCLNRALFIKDIAELKARTEINWPTIHVKAVKAPQEKWVPGPLQRQTFFNHDLTESARHLRKPLAAFGRAFLAAAQKIHRIDAVMAANTDYWQDEAIRLACNEMKIPFMVLSRESYGIGRGRRYVSELYGKAKFHFDGAACAVASQTCQEFMSQLPAMQDSLVRATGWPRYDSWRNLNGAPLGQRRMVTLMAYGDPRQVQYAAANFADVLGVFVAAARRQQDKPIAERLTYVIKIKKANEDGYIHELVPDIIDAGISIVADTPLPNLISQSRAVIGYNTLAVLEALLGDCAVIVPFWGDADRAPADALLHPQNSVDEEVCYFPRSVDEFDALNLAVESGNLVAKGSRQARIARFSVHSDMSLEHSSSERVQNFVREVLAAKRQ